MSIGSQLVCLNVFFLKLHDDHINRTVLAAHSHNTYTPHIINTGPSMIYRRELL